MSNHHYNRSRLQEQVAYNDRAKLWVQGWTDDHLDWARQVGGDAFIRLWEAIDWDASWIAIRNEVRELHKALLLAEANPLGVN